MIKIHQALAAEGKKQVKYHPGDVIQLPARSTIWHPESWQAISKAPSPNGLTAIVCRNINNFSLLVAFDDASIGLIDIWDLR